MAEKNMSIMSHLDELRSRLIISLISLAVGTAIAFAFRDPLLSILIRPSPGFRPVYLELTEMLGVYMQLSLLGGFILTLPVIAYQAAMFIVPGLLPKERRALLIMLPGVTVLFLLGVSFGYFVVLPPTITFLISFGMNVAEPQIRISNYFNVVVTVLFWLGVVFEIPFVMYLLARIKLISAGTLSRYRRYSIVVAFILGALITPTFDPITQTLVSVPIVVLYELGILLAWLARRGEKKEASPVAAADQAPSKSE